MVCNLVEALVEHDSLLSVTVRHESLVRFQLLDDLTAVGLGPFRFGGC